MLRNTNVLISGAGIAGLTLAYWLEQAGFSPTIVEKRPDLSDEGYMIDFYGVGAGWLIRSKKTVPQRATTS
jgi:2-polyprenyl-6-methoxyphenol hydroxylase-like FAD-dependent oxidoreductase